MFTNYDCIFTFFAQRKQLFFSVFPHGAAPFCLVSLLCLSLYLPSPEISLLIDFGSEAILRVISQFFLGHGAAPLCLVFIMSL